ncbi:MAG: glycosyltransferase family 9 protein [Thermoguttaceae bacterium]
MEFPASPQRVLVIQTGEVRDVVASLPFLALLRMRLPRAEIACLASERGGAFLYGHATTDRIIAAREHWNRSYREATFLTRHLATFNADATFDLEATFRSGLLTWMSRAKYRVGIKGASLGGRVAYTNPVATGATDLVSRYLDLLSVLDVEGGSRGFDLYEHEHDRLWAADCHWRLGLANDFVVVPVRETTNQHPTRVVWQQGEYTSLIHFLKSQWNLHVLLLPENAVAVPLAENVAATNDVKIFAGTLGFGETTSLIRRATAVIGPEMDMAYLAAATATPAVVALPHTVVESIAGNVPFKAEQFFSVTMLPTSRSLNIERFLNACDTCLTAISIRRNEFVSSPRRNAA